MLPGGNPYVTAAQLPQYMPPAVLGLASPSQQAQACLDATEEADSYLRGRFGNGPGQPFTVQAVGNDVVRYTAYIAVYLLCTMIGFAPQAGSDANITTNYYRAVGWPDKPGTGWFPGVQRQAIHPDITPMLPIGQNPGADVPQVFTNQPRGWSCRGPQRV